ncbi:MAG: Glu-tRNA(Gln) amidotransferase subunit GatE, partial [Thermoplasmatota archaeon]
MISGEEARKLAISDGELDYKALRFMCGLEIHQQLDTRKLFSPAPSGVVDPDEVAARSLAKYDRRLRATQSELGETDPAALAEAKKRKAFRYLAIDGLTSLVELDEEPPHPMSQDALDVTLTFAGLLGSRPADEVHIMRKTVIDGSNTSGFQRTSLVATGGSVQPDMGGAVSVWTVAVEEDSARKVDDLDGRVTYTLDRLGVPLIEVATGPDITDPKHAQATARRLGALLRTTGRVRRGLGSIRQDLNVSIGVGDRVEIKGCQDLRAVPSVIEKEVRRQLWLHYVAEELRSRGFTPESLAAPADVSGCFDDTAAKMIASTLKKGGKVLALRLPHWKGLIAGHEGRKDLPRYGSEFAAHAKVAAGVKGVFHSDELPAYGIQDSEVTAVREALQLSDDDAFVLCVEREATAQAALEGVARCAADALQGAGRAVRAVQPDDSTRYMRPLPGAARMYPETDAPPIRITQDHWQHILDTLPPLPEVRIATLVQEHGLSEDGATQLVANDQDVTLIRLSGSMDANLAARMLLQVVPDLDDGERAITNLPRLAEALAAGQFAKEGMDKV